MVVSDGGWCLGIVVVVVVGDGGGGGGGDIWSLFVSDSGYGHLWSFVVMGE